MKPLNRFHYSWKPNVNSMKPPDRFHYSRKHNVTFVSCYYNSHVRYILLYIYIYNLLYTSNNINLLKVRNHYVHFTPDNNLGDYKINITK